METKVLKLEGSRGKTENHYSLVLEVPSKIDLLGLLELPPYQIFSKQETTFSSGILAHVPHSIKIKISREYQDPNIGFYLQLKPKPDELIEVIDIKGAFALPSSSPPISRSRTSSNTSTTSNSNNSSTSPPTGGNLNANSNIINFTNGSHFNQYDFVLGVGPQGGNSNSNLNNHNNNPNSPDPMYENFYPYLNNRNSNSQGGNHAIEDGRQQEFSPQQKRALFNFFRTTINKSADMDQYNYYESRCQWPNVASRLCIFLRISKLDASVIVNDESAQVAPVYSSMFNSEPFFLSETCSDVKIKVGSAVFPAHKIILTARSKYFARMFAHQMRETKEGVVTIEDVEECLMKQLLSFVYLGRVEEIETYASDLLLLSDKYDIEDLASYCEKYLLDNLSVDNAIEMYDLSHTVGRRGFLAKKSKEIIMWNKDKFAADLDIFKEFSVKYPDLIFELLKL